MRRQRLCCSSRLELKYDIGFDHFGLRVWIVHSGQQLCTVLGRNALNLWSLLFIYWEVRLNNVGNFKPLWSETGCPFLGQDWNRVGKIPYFGLKYGKGFTNRALHIPTNIFGEPSLGSVHSNLDQLGAWPLLCSTLSYAISNSLQSLDILQNSHHKVMYNRLLYL